MLYGFFLADCIRIEDFPKGEIEAIFHLADKLYPFSKAGTDIAKNRILATLFYEPSTRTRLSFETAMIKLGGSVISVEDAKATSSFAKGETIADTVRTVENYCDIIVMRHSLEGAARIAAEFASVPVINAGDGAHQHPTQALLDLYTIRREKGKIGGLKVALCGDLKYGRTVHSLAYLLAMFGAEITLVAPTQLRYPQEIREKQERDFGVKFTEKYNIADALDSDVIYMTRVQKERFPDPLEYEHVRGSCLLTKELMQNAKKGCIVMHPLPRVDEIDHEIDREPGAVYFRQAGYGVPVRMALISHLLGLKA